MISIGKVVRVKSLEEAYQLNQERTNVVLGGFMWMKMGTRNIGSAIDLSDLGLDTIEETEEELTIGCMCPLRRLELHEGADIAFGGAFREALGHIVGVQFRNGATVGGSLYGRYGFSDVLTLFLALDCDVELHHGGIVPLREFVAMKPDTDILVRVVVRKDGRKVSYLSQRISKTDFPVIAVAAAKKGDSLFVSIGARPSRASLIEKTGCTLDEASPGEEIAAFAAWASGQVTYADDLRGTGAYRKHLASVYVRRAVTDILRRKDQ